MFDSCITSHLVHLLPRPQLFHVTPHIIFVGTPKPRPVSFSLALARPRDLSGRPRVTLIFEDDRFDSKGERGLGWRRGGN